MLGRLHGVPLGIEEFWVIYFLKALKGNSWCFSPRKSVSRLITKVPESDSGWKQSIVLVTGSWESLVPEEHGLIPQAWGTPGMFPISPQFSATFLRRSSTDCLFACIVAHEPPVLSESAKRVISRFCALPKRRGIVPGS